MALAPPPPLVGAGIARPRDGRSAERPMGAGSRGPKRLSNAPSLARRVGRRDPPPLSSPTRGEEAQLSDPRVNSRAEGAKARTRSSTWPRGLMMGADNVFGKKV